ncbi:MAG: hypothetical protein V1917_01405 [Candidatus Gottesmanbacteria bacterium]
MHNPIRTVSIALLCLSLGLWATVIIPSMKTKKTPVTSSPTWQELPRTLTEIETATMSADFAKDFEKNLESINTPPTPTPFLSADVPASQAGDLVPPTVTIQGEVLEGSTVTMPNICFPLWVSDNITSWQQLGTRGKLDDNQWSPWSTLLSYCYQNLGNGVHTFTVQIRDLSGNISQEVKRTFIVKR